MATSDQDIPRYDFKAIESKWQKLWLDNGLFCAPDMPDKDKAWYQLEMFAYPSGDIHMGHFRNYIIGDAVARQKMMTGRQVLHPFGWDAFGLPAERAAIKRSIHPMEWTSSNITNGRSGCFSSCSSADWPIVSVVL